MASTNVFHWLDGRGWLVLSGGVDEDIRATAINRMAADGALAVMAIDQQSDQLLIDLEDMAAPAGYWVDPTTDEDVVVLDKLTDAGLVVITGEGTPQSARAYLSGAPLEGLQSAYERGAVILLEGVIATLFGTWILDGEARDGLEWLEGGVALVIDDSQEHLIREFLAETPTAIVIGVKPGSAIVFGPDGEIETWGAGEVVIRLGSAYSG